MQMTRIWIVLSALIVALLRLSNMERAKEDRDICVKIATALSVIPTVQLPFDIQWESTGYVKKDAIAYVIKDADAQ